MGLRDGSLLRYWGCMLGLDEPPEEKEDLDERFPPYTRIELDAAPPRNKYDCLPLPTEPSPLICLHDVLEDVFISGSISDGVPWEAEVVDAFQRVLEDQKEMGVIDIGANIGQYTLLSAMMGRSVVAVEPFLTHIHMLHTALSLNNLENHVTLLHNAVSDKRAAAVLHFKKNNMGAIRVVESPWPVSGTWEQKRRCQPNQSINRVETIYLDDILELIGFPAAILKLDIEGYESRAMMQARRLLDEVDIRYIFMEWEVLNSEYTGDHTEEVHSLLTLLQHRHYTAYTIDGAVCDPTTWKSWPGEVIWVKRGANTDILKSV